ncbi:hypothetical protein [Flavobacterium sp.]|jgi:hypothetical protein|uniref:hypothetical protein n=1 Tax=Flavobacterium sp. TaxID=239 RepID=UPI0037C0B89C
MRDLLIEKMYEITKKPYQKFFKKGTPWNITPSELIQYNQDSLGFHLGCFLLKYNFQMQPKLEDHDVIHVLTNTSVSVPDEIPMQFFLLGNGKKSAYLFMVITIGTIFYPTQFKQFIKSYNRGKSAHRIHDLDFQKMLLVPVKTIQTTFNIK